MKKSVRKALKKATLALVGLAAICTATLHEQGRIITQERANTPERKLELKQQIISETERRARENIKRNLIDAAAELVEPVLNFFDVRVRKEEDRERDAVVAAKKHLEKIDANKFEVKVKGTGLNLIDALIARAGGKANMFKDFTFEITYEGEIILTFKMDDNWNPYNVWVDERTRFYEELYEVIKNAAMGKKGRNY